MSIALKCPIIKNILISENMINAIHQSLENIIFKLANEKANFKLPFQDENWVSPSQIVNLIDLNTEQIKGQIQFHFEETVAVLLIEKMAGFKIVETANDPDFPDAVGELSNIFYGEAKTRLHAKNIKFNLSIPRSIPVNDLPQVLHCKDSIIIPFSINDRDSFLKIIFY